MDYAETIRAHYIDGNWIEDSDHSQNINPSNTEDIIGRFARGDAGRVDQAVVAAAVGLGLRLRAARLFPVGVGVPTVVVLLQRVR